MLLPHPTLMSPCTEGQVSSASASPRDSPPPSSSPQVCFLGKECVVARPPSPSRGAVATSPTRSRRRVPCRDGHCHAGRIEVLLPLPHRIRVMRDERLAAAIRRVASHEVPEIGLCDCVDVGGVCSPVQSAAKPELIRDSAVDMSFRAPARDGLRKPVFCSHRKGHEVGKE